MRSLRKEKRVWAQAQGNPNIQDLREGGRTREEGTKQPRIESTSGRGRSLLNDGGQ